MFERFTKDGPRGRRPTPSDIARDLGATTIEAEHLLLAVTATRHAGGARRCATRASTTTACATR